MRGLGLNGPAIKKKLFFYAASLSKSFWNIQYIYFCLEENLNVAYQDIQRPLLREEGDGAPASSGTQ